MTVVVNVIQQSDEFSNNRKQTDGTRRQLQSYNYNISDTNNNNIAIEEELEEEEEEEEEEEILDNQTKSPSMTMTCNDKNDEMSRNFRKNTKINPNANDNMYEEEREENLLKHDDNNDDNNGFPYAPPPPLPPLSESVARLSPSSRVDGSVEIHQPEPAPLMLLFDNNEPTQIVHCECTVESLLLIKQQQSGGGGGGGGSNHCAGRRSRKSKTAASSSYSANGSLIRLCDSQIGCKCRRYAEQCHSGCACSRPTLTTPDNPSFQNDHTNLPFNRCYYSNNVGDNYIEDDNDNDDDRGNYDYDDDINHSYRGEKKRRQKKYSLPKACCSNRVPMVANEDSCYSLSLDDNNPTVNHTGHHHHQQQQLQQQQQHQRLNELETTSVVKPNQVDIKCKCRHGSGKKRCLDSSKCACRRVFKICDQQNCKCTANCANFVADPSHPDQHAPNEQVQKWFSEPHRGASRVMVAKLVSDQHVYTADYFVAETKEPRQHVEQIFYAELINAVDQCRMTTLRQICLFMPTSPCFHQDCEPQCDVLDRCQSSKACAETLAIAYKQLQQRLNNSDLQMTVKFLASYVRRGDLYTKQGILCMLQAGISVEPLSRKDWHALVDSDDQQRSRNTRGLWDSLGLTNYAMQSQFYINECRQELGLRQLYWHSALHTLLRDCALAGTRCCRNFGQIRRQFSHEQSRGDFERARRRHRNSLNLIHLRSQSVESSLSRCSRFNSAGFQQQQQLHNFQNTHDTSSTALLVDSAWTRSSNECDSSSLPLTSHLQQKQQQQHRSHHTLLQNSNTSAPSCSILPSYCSSAAVIWPTDQTSISQLIDNLQGRCIDEMEAQEINIEVMKAIDEIQLKIADLLTYLHRTIDSTAL